MHKEDMASRDYDSPGKRIEHNEQWMNSDKRILDDAKEALFRDAEVDATDIKLAVEDNRIILRGSVSTEELKLKAQECVENLPGVEGVRNELQIRS